MFEYYNNILCVQGGWLYKDAGILSKSNYDRLSRLYFNIRRRPGPNTPALVEFESIPERFRKLIIEKFGDPYKSVKHVHFKDYLEFDQKASEYYNNYTLDNGNALPDTAIKTYIANAIVLNAITLISADIIAKRKALGGSMRSSAMWKKIAEIVQELPKHTYPHNLPANHRRLRHRLRDYNKSGYESLIHKNFCNKNSEKINDDAKLWVLSRWASRVNKCATIAQLHSEYNEHAKIMGWKLLKEKDTLHVFLNLEENKALWYGHRYGELRAKEKMTFMHSTKMPTMRDSLWYGDGTKLNYYYLNENGNISTCQVYEVIDAYSEVLLGYHISDSENYEAQYHAYKMAIETAGHKPYQIGFDGQGGHSKLKAGNFLNKITKMAIRTEPYNGNSKTIELAFKNFQTQYLKKDWFFTGQNIQSKSLESKVNMEFIIANKDNLPTLDEVKTIYKKRRDEWNGAKHHKTGQPRLQMYYASVNPESPEVSIWDMVECFWVTRPKPITYTPSGLSFRENKVKYEYVVYGHDTTEDGCKLPDFEFLANNFDKQFIVKFDPTDMDMIRLYEETATGIRFVAAAETKLVPHRGRQEQEDWESAYFAAVKDGNIKGRIERRNLMDKILKDHNMLPEQHGLNSPAIKGVESSRRKKARRKAEVKSMAEYQKEESNMDVLTVEHNLYDRY